MKIHIITILFIFTGIGCFFLKNQRANAIENFKEVELGHFPLGKWFTPYEVAIISLKHREGFRERKYDCPAGYPTIGYGTRVAYVDVPDKVDKHMATELLVDKYAEALQEIKEEFPHLEYNQRVAVAMLVYNIGMTKFKSYSLYRELLKGQPKKESWLSINKYKKGFKYVMSENLSMARRVEWWLFNNCHQELYTYISTIKQYI